MTTSESFRKHVAESLDSVLNSEDLSASVSFSSCLSAEERKYIHRMAGQFGLKSQSHGKGDARFISVERDPDSKVGEETKRINQAKRLRLPKAAWEALEHPLVQHAAKDGNAGAAAQSAPLVAVEGEEINKLLGWPSGGNRPKYGRMRADLEPSGKNVGPPDTQLLAQRKSLPAWNVRAEALKTMSQSQVTIVLGETGCGKSTQMPQFILEEGGEATNVLVTQPRRLSALGLAHRVAQERGEDVGQSVGYSVHLESVSSAQTRLLFCTTGVLRRRLLADPQLDGVTHLVLDELHERDKIADFLLIHIRKLLRQRTDLSLVLMSATMQHETFQKYFPGCAEVHIPGRTFPVDSYYLEEIAPMLHSLGHGKALGPGFAAGGLGFGTWKDKGNEKAFKYKVLVGGKKDGLYGFAANADKELSGNRLEEGLFLHDVLQQTKGVMFDLPVIEVLLAVLADTGQRKDKSPIGQRKDKSPIISRAEEGGVLIFVPGWDDISRLKRKLRSHPVLGDQKRFWILSLHSQIRLEQQREVFRRPSAGIRKIVLSTNIAEASITVDDVRVVIDCGRVKELGYDACLNVPTLNLSWVSKASMVQRRGRAGRTAPGVCFHMYSRQRAEMLDSHRPAEMLRCPLDDLCLHAKLLVARQGQADVSAFAYLQEAPDPPEEKNVLNGERLLREMGALTSGEHKGCLTALGVHLSALPLTPQAAKVVLWASLLGVGRDALAIVSGMQYREPFTGISDSGDATTLADSNTVVRAAKRALCGPFSSDHLALLRACDHFENARAQGGDAASEFCEAHALSMKQMATIKQTLGRIQKELSTRSLWPEGTDRNEGDVALLVSALCAGLFPNLARGTHGNQNKLQVHNGAVDAKPHASSIFANSGKGGGGDPMASHAVSYLDDDGRCTGESGDTWFCFNELSQVEEHYSLSTLTPVPVSVLLLLCGEGELQEISTLNNSTEASSHEAAESDSALDTWWASVPGPSAGSSSEEAQRADDVIVSVPGIEDWLFVRMHRATLAKIQALRAMLGLLFRVFCTDPSRWKELTAEGGTGAVVLDIVSDVIRAEMGPTASTRTDAPGRSNGAFSSHGRKSDDQPPKKVGKAKNKIQQSSSSPSSAPLGPQDSASVKKTSSTNMRGNTSNDVPAHTGDQNTSPAAGITFYGQQRPTQPNVPQQDKQQCRSCTRTCPNAYGQPDQNEAWYCLDCWKVYHEGELQRIEQLRQAFHQNAGWHNWNSSWNSGWKGSSWK